MTRAYIRLDPAFDERKDAYPDGPYAALIATFCLAELQPERGRFRSLDFLGRLLGKRGRHLRYLVEHGDVVVQDDGRAYVDGWDEWQEGDWKVAERVNRIRNRDKSRRAVTPYVTPPVTVDVTVPVTADRLDIAERSVSGALAVGGAQTTPAPTDDAEGEAMTWLARHGCHIRPASGYHRQLVLAVERHGSNAVIGMFDRLAAAGTKDGDHKGFLFGAIDALDAQTRPNLRSLEVQYREQERQSSLAKRLVATQVRLHENGGHFETPSPTCPRCKEGAA